MNEKPLIEKQEEVQKEVFGAHSVRWRNIGGLFAVFTVCITALVNSLVIYLSVRDNKVWPSETSMFIMLVGPVIIAWGWSSVNGTLKTIFTGTSNLTMIRSKVASIIAPTAPQAPKSNVEDKDAQ